VAASRPSGARGRAEALGGWTLSLPKLKRVRAAVHLGTATRKDVDNAAQQLASFQQTESALIDELDAISDAWQTLENERNARRDALIGQTIDVRYAAMCAHLQPLVNSLSESAALYEEFLPFQRSVSGERSVDLLTLTDLRVHVTGSKFREFMKQARALLREARAKGYVT
jgi:hypothetical protein